jgi:hypothetical protein
MARERVLALLFVILFNICLVSASLQINEIMPNPIDSCSDCTEWVEIYNSGLPMAADGFILDAGGKNITLSGMIDDYIIVTKNKTTFLSIWPVDSNKIFANMTSLNNEGDKVVLYDNNGNVISVVTYPSFTTKENQTYSLIQGAWVVSQFPTPLAQNTNVAQNQQSQSLPVQTNNPPPQQNITESYLEIAEYPSKAAFGETIDVKINAYRGDTAKYAIYLYLKKGEDIMSERKTLHLDEKFTNYSFDVQLKINSNCNGGYEEGDYYLLLEGVEKSTLQEISVFGNTECSSVAEPKKGKVTYKVDYPEEVEAGKNFVVAVEVFNNQRKTQQFGAWSYVYKENTCYSCESGTREGNSNQLIIEGYDSNKILLNNTVEDIEEGLYQLKVKILREGYETTTDYKFDIYVKNQKVQETNKSSQYAAESILNQTAVDNATQGTITGEVIYDSKLKKYIASWLLFLLLGLSLLLYLIIKKRESYEPPESEEYSDEEDIQEESEKSANNKSSDELYNPESDDLNREEINQDKESAKKEEEDGI